MQVLLLIKTSGMKSEVVQQIKPHVTGLQILDQIRKTIDTVQFSRENPKINFSG